MCSNSGREVPNQFIICTPDGNFFQSYNSIIAFRPNHGPIVLGPRWDYSATASKYRNSFLGEDTRTTRKKLNEGIYILDETL